MAKTTYSVRFYPAWARGPADESNYHRQVSEIDKPFATLPSAKRAATSTLVEHNRRHRDEKWRAEIWRHYTKPNGAAFMSRSMNGRDIGVGSPHIEWTKAR